MNTNSSDKSTMKLPIVNLLNSTVSWGLGAIRMRGVVGNDCHSRLKKDEECSFGLADTKIFFKNGNYFVKTNHTKWKIISFDENYRETVIMYLDRRICTKAKVELINCQVTNSHDGLFMSGNQQYDEKEVMIQGLPEDKNEIIRIFKRYDNYCIETEKTIWKITVFHEGTKNETIDYLNKNIFYTIDNNKPVTECS